MIQNPPPIIAFIASGKMYEGVKAYVESSSDGQWQEYKNGKQICKNFNAKW